MNCIRCHHPMKTGDLRCERCHHLWQNNKAIPDCVRLSEVEASEENRLHTGPWDLVWGGGIVPNTVTLLGGSPGAGKSTLTLQLADGLTFCKANQLLENPVLYIGSEEGEGQIKSRADRLNLKNQDHIVLLSTLGENPIEDKIERINPSAIILDSLSAYVGLGPSHDAEAIAVTTMLKTYAEENDCPVFIVDHVTKELEFAGLMMLQHLVDVTITLFPTEKVLTEGPEGNYYDMNYRVLRTIKNRHGGLAELVSRMGPVGLVEWRKADPQFFRSR